MCGKIRVLHVVESLEIGGMENGVVNLANRIDKARFQFMVCCFSERGSLADRINNPSVQLFEQRYGQGTHLESVIPLARLFRKNKVDILHTHGWGSRSLVSFLGAKLAGTPVSINGEHGVLHTDKFVPWIIQRLLAPMFQGTLSVSESLKKKLVWRLKLRADKITVIANGVDTSIFHGNYNTKELRSALKIRSRDSIIGVIGTLKAQKNQQVVLHALEKVKRRGFSPQLFLIGDGPDKPLLQDLAQGLGIETMVHFLGYRDDIPVFLSLMDILVLPSIQDHEGMSNVLLEAMASMVPVISSRSVGSEELIQEGMTGLLFNYDNADELASKIQILLEKPDLGEAMKEAAYRKVLKYHRLDMMIERYQDYYIKNLEATKAKRVRYLRHSIREG